MNKIGLNTLVLLLRLFTISVLLGAIGVYTLPEVLTTIYLVVTYISIGLAVLVYIPGTMILLIDRNLVKSMLRKSINKLNFSYENTYGSFIGNRFKYILIFKLLGITTLFLLGAPYVATATIILSIMGIWIGMTFKLITKELLDSTIKSPE